MDCGIAACYEIPQQLRSVAVLRSPLQRQLRCRVTKSAAAAASLPCYEVRYTRQRRCRGYAVAEQRDVRDCGILSRCSGIEFRTSRRSRTMQQTDGAELRYARNFVPQSLLFRKVHRSV
jgi:hypothetical protein